MVSFSGGRSSGYLNNRLLKEEKKHWKDIFVIFANTGQEHEKTLEFINNCDERFGFNTVWIEAVTHLGERKSATSKIVDFKTHLEMEYPSRSYFQIRDPWSKAPHCTQLKEQPIKHYLRSIGLSSKTVIWQLAFAPMNPINGQKRNQT